MAAAILAAVTSSQWGPGGQCGFVILDYHAHGLREEDKPTLSIQPSNQSNAVLFTEAWLTEDGPVPQVPGYFSFNLGARPFTCGRLPGGITVYCANKFSGQILVWRQDSQHQSRIWLKCDSSNFQCNESLFMCALSLPPPDSSVARHAHAANCVEIFLLKSLKHTCLVKFC